MRVSEKYLSADLETLRHGGQEAIALFIKVSRRVHERGTDDALKDWITIAAPALPEAERGEVLLWLMSAFLDVSYELQVRPGSIGVRKPPETIH
jgi:hypothetical protein